MAFPPTIGSSESYGRRSGCLETLGSIQNYELLSKLLKLEHSNRGYVASLTKVTHVSLSQWWSVKDEATCPSLWQRYCDVPQMAELLATSL